MKLKVGDVVWFTYLWTDTKEKARIAKINAETIILRLRDRTIPINKNMLGCLSPV